MFFKKLKKSFILLFLSTFIIPINALAYSKYIIPGGENVGITLSSKGVIIVGTYEINGKNPAKEAGLKIGDIISNINNSTIEVEMFFSVYENITDYKEIE